MYIFKQGTGRVVKKIFSNLVERERQKMLALLESEKVECYVLPNMGEWYVGFTLLLFYLMIIIAILCILITIVSFILCPIETAEDWNYVLDIALLDIVMVLGVIASKIANRVYWSSRILFYNEHFVIKSYWHPDQIINYDEINTAVKE